MRQFPVFCVLSFLHNRNRSCLQPCLRICSGNAQTRVRSRVTPPVGMIMSYVASSALRAGCGKTGLGGPVPNHEPLSLHLWDSHMHPLTDNDVWNMPGACTVLQVVAAPLVSFLPPATPQPPLSALSCANSRTGGQENCRRNLTRTRSPPRPFSPRIERCDRSGVARPLRPEFVHLPDLLSFQGP